MALDSKQFQALSVLGWNFALHLIKSISPAHKDEQSQAELFRSYFIDDNITGFTPVERQMLLEFQKCIGCGLCAGSCRAMSLSQGRFLGPEHIALSSSRSQPDFAHDADSVFRCAVCGQCEPICPEDVPITAAVMHMRSMIRRVSGEAVPAPIKQLAANLDETGMLYGKSLVNPAPCADNPSAVLFLGCRESQDPERAQRLMGLISRLGISFTTIEETCCGGVPATLGIETGFGLADRLLAEGLDTVITVCPHCHSVLSRDPELKDKLEVKHILSLIEEKMPEGLKIKTSGPVAFHDPCYLARGAGIIELPRKMLETAGAELKQMEQSGLDSPCCGAGGGLAAVDPELAAGLAKARLEEAKQAGASMIVTECSGCKNMLGQAAGEGEPTVALLTDLISAALNET